MNADNVAVGASTSPKSSSSASSVRPPLVAEFVLAVIAVGFGGIVAGWLGLIVATASIAAIGLRLGGLVGGATALMVFSGSVSVSHYGFGSPEWTESEDRVWMLAVSLSIVAAVMASAWTYDRARRLSVVAGLAALLTATLVDASLEVRLTSAAVMAAVTAFGLIALLDSYSGMRPNLPLVRTMIDLTLAVGVALDLSHDIVGGFGGRGPARFGVERWIGTTLDPNEFGELALLALGLTMILRVRDASPWLPLAGIRLTTYALLILVSGSRTSIFLAFVLVTVVALVEAGPRLRSAFLVALVIGCLGVVVMWSDLETSLIRDQNVEGASVLNGRTDIWEIAIEERMDNPISALGFGGSEGHFREVYETSRPIPWENISTHNRLLEAWGAFGLHGAVILLAMWAVSLKRAVRPDPVTTAVVTVSIVSSMMLPVFGSLRPGAWMIVPVVLAASSPDRTLYARLP